MCHQERMGMKNIYKLLSLGGALAAAVLVGPALANAATLSLSPTSGTTAAGSSFEVKINLDTGSVSTNGTDAYIRFDPNTLQVVDANASTSGTQILAGSLYTQTSFNSVDNGAGKISFSGSKSGGSAGYSGSGTLATITFQAVKAAATTPVTIDFTAGSTTDSNVVNTSSSDVLTSVTNASYVVTGAAATPATTGGTLGDSTGTTTSAGGGTDADGDGLDDITGEPVTTSASGQSGTDGAGGSATVAGTGIDLSWYLVLTVLSLIGAGYFLTRKPRHR